MLITKSATSPNILSTSSIEAGIVILKPSIKSLIPLKAVSIPVCAVSRAELVKPLAKSRISHRISSVSSIDTGIVILKL